MTRDILELIVHELGLEVNRDEVREIQDEIQNGDYNDFIVEIDKEEYRFIHEDFIWEIYVDEIKRTVEESYTGVLEWWIAVDWEETAENCLQDGYGHTFGCYDGKEHEWKLGEENYYIFRTN